MVRDGWWSRLAQGACRLGLGVLVGVLLAGCSAGAAPTLVPISTPTAAAPSSTSGGGSNFGSGGVTASGEVVPAQNVDLGFALTGLVQAVNVKVGDRVEAGQVLVQLKGRERAEADVAGAQQEIAAAQLENEAAQQELAAAETERLDAQKAITDMVASTARALTLAQMQADIANTQKQIEDAQRNLRYLTSPDIKYYQDQLQRAQDGVTMTLQTADMTDMQIAVTQAQESLDQRTIELNDVKAREGWGGAKPVLEAQKNYDVAVDTLKNAQLRLAQAQIANGNSVSDAQKALDDARKALSNAMQGPDAVRLQQAQANLGLLKAQLSQAQSDEATLKANDGVDPDKLKAAQDRVTAADHRVAAAQARIASAEARLPAVQASLVAAQAALDGLSLTAPFAGNIVSLDIGVGEIVLPGQTLVRLADLEHLQIETTDLSEKDISQVTVGQPASIYVEALRSDVKGQVTRIASDATKLGGDVVYAVTLQLTEQPKDLRWGMTVKVTITPK
jgi:HlyD family secretion protein